MPEEWKRRRLLLEWNGLAHVMNLRSENAGKASFRGTLFLLEWLLDRNVDCFFFETDDEHI
jgi:hypothetical protein